jgi:hypothetical protein
MRWSIFILILLVFGCNRRIYPPDKFLVDQSPNEPFQVLTADSAMIGSKQLRRYDLLNLSDVITLRSGFVILVHYSGKFLEFQGDTTISVMSLNESIELTFKLENIGMRPDFSFLFFKDYEPTAVIDGMGRYPIHFTNPGPQITVVDANNFCLSWTAVEMENVEYILTIQNIFAEQIAEFSSKDTVIQFNPASYNESTLVAQVSVSGHPTYQSNPQGIKYGETINFVSPNQCSIKNSVEALETAYHMERYYYLAYDARRYYQLAVDLSDQPAYSEFLANYVSRRTK